MRTDGRRRDELRKLTIEPHVARYAEGSVLISVGHTKVMCTASVDPGVPKWLQGQGRGWVTAEYGMLPRSTHTRISREKSMTGGRTQEISRLIGRSLRAGVDLSALGERQINIDCDVIQADGGTRTASITGGFVALALCLKYLREQRLLSTQPLKHYISAISAGVGPEGPILDLNYDEDSTVDTDINIVMNDAFDLIEIQGTAEGRAFSRASLDELLEISTSGIRSLFLEQQKIIGDFFSLER
jgi:ribonuclease PH